MAGKKLTRVDVIALIVLLPLFLVVLLSLWRGVRKIDPRLTCGVNLYGIGKVMQVYCDDYDGRYPRAGGPTSVWARCVKDWQAEDDIGAYGLDPKEAHGYASISSCMYLLIKYYDLKPNSFVCGGDSGVTVFNPVDYNLKDGDLTSLWDFGPSFDPDLHVSYSYHTPFNEYALTASSDPGMAVVADRNPWITNEAAEKRSTWVKFNPLGGKKAVRLGNSVSHQEKGQNVLFLDGHVSFEDKPSCGVNNDNIYTFWYVSYLNAADICKGIIPLPCTEGTEPQDKTDSLLVHGGELLIFPYIRGLSPEDIQKSLYKRSNADGNNSTR